MSAEAITAEVLVAGSAEPLIAATIDGVRIFVLNRPQARNALTLQMRKDFARLAQEAEADPSIRAIVITGAHATFSAGVDVKELASGAAEGIFRPHPGEVARSLGKPSIAAVDGICITGALELALSCNFIVASDRSRFADTHGKVGLFPGWGQTALLTSAIGVRRARQMSLTGAFVDAQTALAWGLVNEITRPDTLLPRALELCAQMAAVDARISSSLLRVYRSQDGSEFETALEAETAARLDLQATIWSKRTAKS
ncbi:enoyl-CoA hydratase-related protein [Rhizorhapis sp. SPR117]|uniref:enoyl-CoA hydratase-related protein n=1 Tax=Rhizorhapis sp. SPR117 TaxID=2912611 RepID=UPI001F007802|nr:enoyl-CoA hydratase-related protein [Rhizorhapis sp. SPR117]